MYHTEPVEENSTVLTLDLGKDIPQKNMQPFRETLSEFEMIAKVGMCDLQCSKFR